MTGDTAFGCREFLSNLRSYMNDLADAGTRAAIERHRDACARCKGVWDIAFESSCADLANFLHEYLDDTLAVDQREVFERHLGLCPECVTYMETYKECMELARDAYGDDVPAAPSVCTESRDAHGGMPPALLAAILAARRSEVDGA